jgi:hypothetical protein
MFVFFDGCLVELAEVLKFSVMTKIAKFSISQVLLQLDIF